MMSLLALTPARRRRSCCRSCFQIHHVGDIGCQPRARICRLHLQCSTAMAEKESKMPGYPLLCPVGKLTNLVICNPHAATELIEGKMAFEVVTVPKDKELESVYTKETPGYQLAQGTAFLTLCHLIWRHTASGTPDRPIWNA